MGDNIFLESSDQSGSSGGLVFSQLGSLSERGGLEGLPCSGSRIPIFRRCILLVAGTQILRLHVSICKLTPREHLPSRAPSTQEPVFQKMDDIEREHSTVKASERLL